MEAVASVDERQELLGICKALHANLAKVLIDKEQVIDLLLVALLCRGNILLEDIPGVGKTTLAKALARSLDARFSRVQFTPDLLPSDILGGSVYNPQTGEFTFRPGPIFANIVLADEINRASPRTQSALLEAMTEGQATIEGVRRPMESTFLVIATQNPIEFHGTYPLPEAQLDRFLVRLEIGYPAHQREVDILFAQQQRQPLEEIGPVTDCAVLDRVYQQVCATDVERSVADYIVQVIAATRSDGRLRLGASPRASLMLFRAAQAQAFLAGRDFVIPDDVKQLAVPVLSHRVMIDTKAQYAGTDKTAIIADLVDQTVVPV